MSDSTSSLAFEIRARINPQIEGLDAFKENLAEAAKSFSVHVQPIIDPPKYADNQAIASQQATVTPQNTPIVTQEANQPGPAAIRKDSEFVPTQRTPEQQAPSVRNINVPQQPTPSVTQDQREVEKQRWAMKFHKEHEAEIKSFERERNDRETRSRDLEYIPTQKPSEQQPAFGDTFSYLKNRMESIGTTVSSRMEELFEDENFTKGLSSRQVDNLERITSISDLDQHKAFQENQNRLMQSLEVDLSSGHITPAMKRRHISSLLNQKSEIDKVEESIFFELNKKQEFKTGDRYQHDGINGKLLQVDEFVDGPSALFMENRKTRGRREIYPIPLPENPLNINNIEPEKRELFFEALKQGFRDSREEIDKFIDSLKNLPDQSKRTRGEVDTLFDKLRDLSSYALGGMVIREGLNYLKTDAQIAAREKTSFDLSSPIGMEAQRERFDVFKENTERSRDYRIGGSVLGMAAGAAASVVTGGAAMPFMLAGFGFGNYAGSEIAGNKNIIRDAETDARLQRRSQIFTEIGSAVAGSSEYDILRARTKARIGEDSIGSLGLGYMPEQELQMRNTFADARGKYDPQLYKEQTTFARSEGIDPDAIYSLNLSARMTGMDVGITGLDQARQIATATYGENVSSQRIVDVLNSIKNLNEKLLQTNVDMDSRDATRMSALPEMIFGKDSTFGKMGERGGETLNILNRFGQGGNLAQEAWLYSAYGVQDPLEFLERQRKGSLDPENFAAISGKIKSESGGNMRMGRYIAEGLLNWDRTIPANFVPDVVDYMLSGEEPTKENLDKKVAELQKKYGKNLSGYKTDAEGAVSQTERNQSEMKAISNTIGDSYRGLFNRMEKDWLSTWKDLSISTTNRIKLETELNGVLEESKKRFAEFFSNAGTGATPGSEADQYINKGRNRGRFEGPPIPEGEALENIKKKLGREDTGLLKDAHGRPATGWVAEKISRLQKELSESALGGRYRINLLEGNDPTGKGHMPGSFHYENLAADVQLYDKFAKERISKGNYPKEVKDYFHQFAEREGISYGGDYRRPDENHFEHNSGRKNEHSFYETNTKSRSEGNANFDPNTIRSAIMEGFRELARGNNNREEIRVVVEDKTQGGISVEQFENVRRNANSIFGGGEINPHANSVFK